MTSKAKGTSIFQAEEVSAKVLGKLKEAAVDYYGSQCVKCIVTVPAYFNYLQRRATEDACTLAGLQCVLTLDEPTAAALSCGLHIHSQAEAAEKNILIFVFSDGTLDVSIFRIEAGRFRVLATSGDCHLGGQDVDNAHVEHFRNFYKEENKKITKSFLQLPKHRPNLKSTHALPRSNSPKPASHVFTSIR